MSARPQVGEEQLVLDAGALISLERGNELMRAALTRALQHERPIVVPAGVLAQVWRSSRQVRIARLLADPGVEVATLDRAQAKVTGVLCGVTKASDVVDASVVVCARMRPSTIITSDPDHLRKLDPHLRLLVV